MTRPSFSAYRNFLDGLPGMLRIGSAVIGRDTKAEYDVVRAEMRRG